MLKIIAGKFKGFKLKNFDSVKIRPTPGKVREAVFDILGSDTLSSNFLDLFAGTGAVGIEALSRGAQSVTFVDRDKQAIGLIKNNLKKINSTDFSYIIKSNYLNAFEKMETDQKRYGIIFIDPPYKKDFALKVMIKIDKYHIAKRNSIIVLQHHVDEKIENNFKNMALIKEKKYGNTSISIYIYKN